MTTAEFRKLVKLVNGIVVSRDPMGLLSMGAPSDEYASEARIRARCGMLIK